MKKKYIIFIAFSFCEGVVDSARLKKELLKKKKNFVVNRKVYIFYTPVTFYISLPRRPVFESKKSIHKNMPA